MGMDGKRVLTGERGLALSPDRDKFLGLNLLANCGLSV